MPERKDQAVIVIHGIGEQKPMDTIRGFVEAVLPGHPSGIKYFSRQDTLSECFELRKLQNRTQPRTHFFEYYWAYKVEGTRLGSIWNWVQALLFRNPWKTVPTHLRALWWSMWILFLMIVAAVVLGLYFKDQFPFIWALGGLIFAIIEGWLITSLGDAARYLNPAPGNIALRLKIKSDGINLLRKIHESKEYDRVIIVGHSLGSVIAYDILKYLWEEYRKIYDCPSERSSADLKAAIAQVEKAGEKLNSHPNNHQDLANYQDAQIELWRTLRQTGNPWLVTDFITMGSPLAHGSLLLANDRKEFEERKRQRELPTCPPVLDESTKGYSYVNWTPYKVGDKEVKLQTLHSAAGFACTRWTNLYFPVHRLVFGDIIGGPLKKWFGAGIKDIPVAIKGHNPLAQITAHCSYWKKDIGTDSLLKIISTLDLDGKQTFGEAMAKPSSPEKAEETHQ